MIRIAIIGDIGSGKSYVSKLFGYPVFNADVEVIKLYRKNKKCYNKLKKKLPKYIVSFPIRKSELFQAITKNKNNLKEITKIIHPEVRVQMNKFIKKNKRKKIVILDIPLLIENKLNKKNDILIFIDAKRKEVNKRLKKRLNFNPIMFKQLKKLQLPLEFKKKKSHFVIKNNFNNNLVKKSVKNIINSLH